MPNPFVHLELNTPDLQKAKSFYSDLFGWQFQDMKMSTGDTYSTFKPSDGPGGGIMSMSGAPTMWLPYVGVDDLRASTDKATSLGAGLIRDVTEVPGMGWFSIVSDPTGAAIALWEPKKS